MEENLKKYKAAVESSGKEIFGDLVGKYLIKTDESYMHEFYWVSYIRGTHIGAVEIHIVDSGDNHSLSASVADKSIRLNNLDKYTIVEIAEMKERFTSLLNPNILKFLKEVIK